ncbi:hypothetical protein M404DRAFT_136278, partial [Pisolithus tinctorius Marx 270]
LHKEILAALPLDPLSQHQLTDTSNPRWLINSTGLLHLDNQIYVPDANNLQLKVLQYKHDHPLSRHLGQNQMLELIWREYTWPSICTFVKEYVRSCTTCARAKTPRHQPYGTLKQLLIPEKPWNSISMDFIEHLPASGGHTAILVVID